MSSTNEGSPEGFGPGGSQSALRSANEARVLEALRSRGALTQAELARRTSLAPSTVSKIVHTLLEAGVVDMETDKQGRRGQLVALSSSAGLVAGIDMGRDHVHVALADLAHQVVAEQHRTLPHGHSLTKGLGAADDILTSLLDGLGQPRTRVISACLSIPAPVDADGSISASTLMPGWNGVNLASSAEEVLGLPVLVENDANLGAVGEATWGAGRDIRNLVYLKMANGIGAGLILNGEIFRGATGSAGELGHTTVVESGAMCQCGNRGCLETVASSAHVIDLLAPTRGRMTIPRIVELAREGDPGCRRVLGDTGRVAGLAVANLCNIVNPQLLIVGGELSAAEELLLDPMRQSVRLHGIPGAVRSLEIVRAELGARAHVLGAVAHALANVTPEALTATS
ncbi:ROK family transcriptional regulator [Raineyella sp. LH-20]|uniref:ROK family transcriptional regulator n=1 Tax=Raineyella sp. LH-20 TaxID=3081204 RepID=UPI0029551B4B|nr:ROK family transcriptional regulator [Raineyella sp. LH-20]WOP19975.1 ROK family transcriptional regulator [Raineyella sp. LH-20]